MCVPLHDCLTDTFFVFLTSTLNMLYWHHKNKYELNMNDLDTIALDVFI